MDESELFEGRDEVVETEDGFRKPPPRDESAIDSEVDFDDEEYTDEEVLMGEREAGNAEGGENGHLDDRARAAAEEYP